MKSDGKYLYFHTPKRVAMHRLMLINIGVCALIMASVVVGLFWSAATLGAFIGALVLFVTIPAFLLVMHSEEVE